MLIVARKTKATKVEVVKKNPGVFSENEVITYRKTLVEELVRQSKGNISDDVIKELADSVLNKDERKTLWLRNKGVLQVVPVLIRDYLKEEIVA